MDSGIFNNKGADVDDLGDQRPSEPAAFTAPDNSGLPYKCVPTVDLDLYWGTVNYVHVIILFNVQ